jgi:hypothetical protein
MNVTAITRIRNDCDIYTWQVKQYARVGRG